jgi:dipeptidyl aminopeptidase/acylaminoacyl peptidase
MGTSNRTIKYHDVCWKNLADAGFPDRIAWIKAAAVKYPYMDLSRVGIYGGSAGGQNAACAVMTRLWPNAAVSAAIAASDLREDAIWPVAIGIRHT